MRDAKNQHRKNALNIRTLIRSVRNELTRMKFFARIGAALYNETARRFEQSVKYFNNPAPFTFNENTSLTLLDIL